jgi:phospholipid/cholesterol/gamma-HCH transport system substrate-binding protein
MNHRSVVQISRYGRSFLTLLVLMMVGLGAGFYILIQQRLPNPFTHFISVNAAFPTAAAVVPGLGEPVDVAGVHIGEILSTTLRNGEGIVHMEIDPKKGVPHLYRNASAQLVPNTPLMDMYVDIDPGTPSAGILPSGGTIPAAETTSPTSADELLDELDTDTRDWLTSLITELAGATRGRGQDIRRLLLDLGPTSKQLRQIGDLLARRRTELGGLVHNVGVLAHATSRDDTQLAGVVRSGDATVQALATQNGALRQSLSRLPATLDTTRSTLTDLTSFSEQLGPTATALIPTARDLPTTLRDTRTLIRGAALLPLNEIKRFEDAVTPLTRVLPAVRRELTTTVPELENTFKVLQYVVNETAYSSSSNPGFLYWLAWFAHNTDSFVGNADANGTAWRTLAITSCTSFQTFSFGPLVQALLGTTLGCPATGGGK